MYRICLYVHIPVQHLDPDCSLSYALLQLLAYILWGIHQ